MDKKEEDKISRSRTLRKSMREAFGIKKSRDKPQRPIDGRLSEYFRDLDNAASKISDAKIAQVREKIGEEESSSLKDADIALALACDFSSGNPSKAYELLEILERSEAGVIDDYSPDVPMLGAFNRFNVTCWLDSLLFAMFARASDFDPMLFHTFDDPAKKRLAVLIRLWINFLRNGHLITSGITQQIQDSLAECGWREGNTRQQQDAAEAFGRLTEFLDLPPLTLKKDMFHQGKADKDDHKFTHERTIDLGIPPPNKDGAPIKLEDCLEDYFDETVNVNRQREEYARRNTVGADYEKSIEAGDVKNKALHVEIAEISPSGPSTPTSTTPVQMHAEGRPQLTELGRIPSIFSERKVETDDALNRQTSVPSTQRKRSATIGKQVSMRAFQFFRLIPWYTEGNPNTDLQVAQHFESKRPAIGICLKRFVATDNSGTKWTKRTDHIDIPIESGIPSFLHDDDLGDEVFPNWKFKLSLQSAICHRGESLDKGHYVSLVRAERPTGKVVMPGAENIPPEGNAWVLHDDLRAPRVRYVNIEKALREEQPYLLFYKIVLIDDGANPGRVSFDGRPTSHSSTESASQTTSTFSPRSSARPSHSDTTTTLSTAPVLARAKSDNSSVVSNTLDPPLPAHTGASEVGIQHHRLTSAPENPTTSVSEMLTEPIAALKNVKSDPTQTLSPDDQQSSNLGPAASKSTDNSRSRPSTSGKTGSKTRLSSIFKSQSKEALAGSDPNAAVNGTGDERGRPLQSKDEALQSPAIPEEGRPPSRKGFRKSMDEYRSARRKDKGKEKGHGKESSLSGKRKAKRGEGPDRECSVM